MARYQHHDRYSRQANQLGLPSRAAFKLEELLRRFKLVGEGGRVIDLGCAPGGWLAVLARTVGSRGRVVGVDIVACPLSAANVVTLTGDVAVPEVRRMVADALGSAADLMTSDLAPKLSGIAERDQASSRELLNAALALAQTLLRPGGALIAKVFMSPELQATRELFARDFTRVEVVRTRASRPGSAELFLVARGFQGRRFPSPVCSPR
jgi:23S rRNA (uridine2552-2'-O)-methyltransferase